MGDKNEVTKSRRQNENIQMSISFNNSLIIKLHFKGLSFESCKFKMFRAL